jgi:hypothetical protein
MGDPFGIPGEWLKSALHVHTSNSDGEEPPQRVISRYEEAGWDVVCVTDHWVITQEASTGRMLTITGAELEAELPAGGGRTCHVLALGVPVIPDDPAVRGRGAFTDLSSAAAWIQSEGGVAFLAHPYCSGVDPQIFREANGVLGIEVFNAGYEIESGCGGAEWFRDAVLGAGRPCLTIATDDSHDGPDCLNAWTMIRAAERSREGVLEALREGHFYASAGPTIYDARRDGDSIEVRSSPVRSVRLRTIPHSSTSVSIEYPNRSGRIVRTDSAGLITEARVEPDEAGLPWVLAEVVDSANRTAWTNPL